jgi:hypothetical protein
MPHKDLRGRARRRAERNHFNQLAPEEQVRLFLAWLPAELRDAPDLDWTHLPRAVMGYFLYTVDQSPDAGHLVLAIGSTQGAMRPNALMSCASRLHNLLAGVRRFGDLGDLADVTPEAWRAFGRAIEMTPMRRDEFHTYATITQKHWPSYLERLEPAQRARFERYTLPPLPHRFLEAYVPTRQIDEAAQRRRKERSDVLVPLVHVLVALVRFRKNAAARLLEAFRAAVAQVEAGEATLPFAFVYDDVLADVNRNATGVADLHRVDRPVCMRFLLWDPRSWVREHPDRFSKTARQLARTGRSTNPLTKDVLYRPEAGHYFVQFLGPAEDLLWFGDLVRDRLMMELDLNAGPETLRRRARARTLGAKAGFATSRSGLLTPPGHFGGWLSRLQRQEDELLFEPASLYLGTLFGAALATLALSNGARSSELLQVSADRFVTRCYEPPRDSRPAGERRVIVLQHLLAKGTRTEAERQLFPISPWALELLTEIGSRLRAAHGGSIPCVAPNGSLHDYLRPERYLFQWAASPDGRKGVIDLEDLSVLLRFVLHGLELRTAQGEPFIVSAHLLRHVTATAARHDYGVPAEAIAVVLHHRQRGRETPSATEYYTQLPQERREALFNEYVLRLEERAGALEAVVPEGHTFETLREDLRAVFERWQTLHPTAFGFCGSTTLCPRGTNRALCIGCPFLVPEPSNAWKVEHWRASYARQADQLERQGDGRDARQARLAVRDLDALLATMRLLQQARDDGRYPLPQTWLPMLAASGDGQHDD